MLTQAQADQFHRDGFLNAGKVLDGAFVEELRAELDRVVKNKGNERVKQPVSISDWGDGKGGKVIQIVNIYEASPAFERLTRLPRVTEEIAQLTGAQQLRVWHDQIQFKTTGPGGVNMWHQDSPYWPILRPATQVSAWFALDDVDADNGCMSMVAGSHKWGDQIAFLHTLKAFDQMPAELPPQFGGHKLDVRLAPVKKGCVHYHHGLTWHGSHANTSDRQRRAIAVHYMTQETRYVEAGSHLMKKFVTVPDGAVLEGERFPLVWEAPVTAAATR